MPPSAPRFQEYCPRCKSIVRIPESLTLDAFLQIVALHRGGQTLRAVAALRDTGVTDLFDAKRLVFHIPVTPGHCHRCDKPLPTTPGLCPSCNCLNLDFAELR